MARKSTIPAKYLFVSLLIFFQFVTRFNYTEIEPSLCRDTYKSINTQIINMTYTSSYIYIQLVRLQWFTESCVRYITGYKNEENQWRLPRGDAQAVGRDKLTAS